VTVTGPARRIILADDNGTVRRVLTEVLALAGHEVLPASTGAEALGRLAEAGAIALLITDFEMPGMNGWDLVRAARLAVPGLRVGVISGIDPPPPPDGAPIEFILRKPFGLRVFEDAVARALR
jgi:CheY-like chemotaxis protein